MTKPQVMTSTSVHVGDDAPIGVEVNDQGTYVLTFEPGDGRTLPYVAVYLTERAFESLKWEINRF